MELQILKDIQTIEITSKETMEEATVLLSRINRKWDEMKEEKERVTKPLNEALKAERARWKPMEDKAKEAVQEIKDKMTSYQLEVEAAAKIAEEKISNRVKAGKGNLSLETAVKKMEEVEQADNKVKTEEGSVQFVKIPDFEVMDVTLLPMEYILPNEVAIRKAMREGKKLTGVRYYESTQVRNSR